MDTMDIVFFASIIYLVVWSSCSILASVSKKQWEVSHVALLFRPPTCFWKITPIKLVCRAESWHKGAGVTQAVFSPGAVLFWQGYLRQ